MSNAGNEESLPLDWHDPRTEPFDIKGLGWFAKERIYRRLPKTPAHPISAAVDSLANCTSGALIRFRTDSGRLAVRVRLLAPASMNVTFSARTALPT